MGCVVGAFAACGNLAPDDVTPPGPDPDGGASDARVANADASPDANSGPGAPSEDGGEGGSDSGANPDARSECSSSFDAGAQALFTGVVVDGIQNIPAGVTPTGSTVLVQRGLGGACITGLSLYISDEIPAGSGVYQTLAVPSLAGMDTEREEGVTITPDGLTLIALNATDHGFLTSTRSAVGKVDFSTPVAGDFAQITTSGSANVWGPVISPDGAAFYYTIINDTSDPSTNMNGIYESVRDAGGKFPPGIHLPAVVQNFGQYVNGLSMDRRAIFLTSKNDNGPGMFTRDTKEGTFSNPLAPNAPPFAPGVRSRPLAGCKVLVGSFSPGGCINESIYTWPIR
jgi:hypothetical protein